MTPIDIYQQYPIELTKGKGCVVHDSNGKEYIDFYGGHGVISIGHAHPEFVASISQQLNKLAFYSNAFKNSLQDELATLLGNISGYKDYQLFLSNSGAEANENALKVASFCTGRKKVLAIKGAFHGRSAGAVAVTDNKSIQPAFGSGIEVDFITLNDFSTLNSKLCSMEYAAFILEGIQGVNGIWEPDTSFLKAARLLCTQTDTVLIIDEVQSGYGRSGKFFAHQYHDVIADVVTVGKGMGNGFPVAATLINPSLKLEKGKLGTTFGGGHLACTAAISVLKTMDNENLCDRAFKLGNYIKETLETYPAIKTVRGRGLMLGIEFFVDAKEVRQRLINDFGFITGFSQPDILRILPPLSITEKEIDFFLKSLCLLLKKMIETENFHIPTKVPLTC